MLVSALIEAAAVLSVSGFFIGFLAGLVGIGGGMLFVPVFWFVFPFLDIPGKIIVKSSVATSLACMTVTSSTSAYHHIKEKFFRREIFLALITGAIPGVFAGSAMTAVFLPPHVTKILFALFLAFMSFKMLLKKNGNGEEIISSLPSAKVIAIIGFFAGFIASMLGVGGGALITPLLHSFAGIPIKEAMATNTGVVFFNSLFSTLNYIVYGWKCTKLPFFLGYVYLPALIFMIPFIFVGTKMGVKVMHKSHPEKLRKIFSIVLLLVALNIVIKTLGR
ncbi:sulfite exporter TauE/SafE family protein [Desulfurobacterium sp.]|uniref:sulfite exporter TauE/SafE family protein n=1 Tax=Desulfurobacterium sp. TaxID=2004706 RepID=UPI00261D14D8|nr:sulfite exporter TauE/SafE family protein [Desulfurobacterium sp.]